jgi:hypothetical protein
MYAYYHNKYCDSIALVVFANLFLTDVRFKDVIMLSFVSMSLSLCCSLKKYYCINEVNSKLIDK